MTKINIIGPAPGEEYEQWEAKRKELWELYRPHYLQAVDEVEGANLFVFEHCVLEIRLCNEGLGLENLTDKQREEIVEYDSNAVTVMEELYREAKLPVDARLGDVTCRRCGRLARGFKIYINLPAEGPFLYDESCNSCR